MEHHFNIAIAKEYGIEEAILLHHFYYWTAKNAANGKHIHDGLCWTYNSKKAYAEFFTYMNETKIFRVIKNLEEQDVIVKGNYNEDKWDRTNWYAITRKGLEILKANGYEVKMFLASLQNDVFDCVKVNDGACQSERPIPNNNITNNNTYKEKKEIDKSISKKTSSNGDILATYDLSSVPSEYIEVVREWCDYKRARREKYKTQQSFDSMVKRLVRLSGGNPQKAIAIVEQSIGNNYAGLFELRQNNGGNNMSLGFKIEGDVLEKMKKQPKQAW